jgi:hypothetical protein
LRRGYRTHAEKNQFQNEIRECATLVPQNGDGFQSPAGLLRWNMLVAARRGRKWGLIHQLQHRIARPAEAEPFPDSGDSVFCIVGLVSKRFRLNNASQNMEM